MALKFDPACESAVADCRTDTTSTNWVTFKYEGKNKLVFAAKGSGGFSEFQSSLADDQCTWAFLRVIAGDQESKRAKFVLVQYNGPSLGGMAKSRAGIQKPEIEKMVGQHHVFYFADGPEDMTEAEVMEKVTKSSGANYDLGSNAAGYTSKAGDIKNTAASTYKAREKEGNVTNVIFHEGPLAKSTPCDLSGRPTVAPPTDARKNTDLAGKLDVDKWKVPEGQSRQPDEQPAES
mmetsp:Transcript_23211/g.47375  ORF Transcript_23211/g.47375 Transcript_23211/m.47375 type:complete len:234 (+) Transcript_23211:145-846(+)